MLPWLLSPYGPDKVEMTGMVCWFSLCRCVVRCIGLCVVCSGVCQILLVHLLRVLALPGACLAEARAKECVSEGIWRGVGVGGLWASCRGHQHTLMLLDSGTVC